MKSLMEMFFDSDSRQRGDINDARDNIQFLQQYASGLDGNLQRMFQTIRTQAEQIRVLTATVETLLDALEERALVDETTLRARVADRLKPAQAAPEAGARGGPYRQSAKEETIRCDNCGTNVPKSMTTMTGDGVVCDDCVRQGAAG